MDFTGIIFIVKGYFHFKNNNLIFRKIVIISKDQWEQERHNDHCKLCFICILIFFMKTFIKGLHKSRNFKKNIFFFTENIFLASQKIEKKEIWKNIKILRSSKQKCKDAYACKITT